MPESRLLLAEVEDVKNFLGKPDNDVTDDDLIYDILRGTCEDIEHFCDRKFNARIYKEFYMGDGSNRLLTRQYPIIAIGGKLPQPGGVVAPATASGEMIDYSVSQDGVLSQVVNQQLGVWDDVSWDFTPGLQAGGTQKPPVEIVLNTQCPGLIQLAGDIFINSMLWSFYKLENIMVIYQAGYLNVPREIRIGAVKLTALDYLRSKGLLSSIEWEKDPEKMEKDVWDDLSQHRREM